MVSEKESLAVELSAHILDNYLHKDTVRKEHVSHDELRKWLGVCMPLQDFDKRVALFKNEISRLKGIEKHYQEHIKNCNVFGNESKPEDKPKKIKELPDLYAEEHIGERIDQLIIAVNYLLERANELMQFDLTTEIGRKEYDHFMKQRSK